MKNKGFTLIELLAVIVILAIIALIAMPVITNTITEARKGSAKASALGYIDAVEKQIMINATSHTHDEITDNTYPVPLDSKYGVTVKGKEPDSGKITIEKGKVTAYTLVVDGYTISFDGENKSIEKTGEVCTEYEENEVVYQNGTPKQESFSPKCKGNYKIELWGAQGGSTSSSAQGGYGGYSTGVITLTKKNTLYINIGGQGEYNGAAGGLKHNGGHNGGGNAYNNANTVWGSGGGATHIAFEPGTLASLGQYKGTLANNSYYVSDKIIIVAGGGGGAGAYLGGSGGGFKGTTGGGSAGPGVGGTQTAGGAGGSANPGMTLEVAAGFGQGGSYAVRSGQAYDGGAGGGGGFYGGGPGYMSSSSAGGGSGYIANANLKEKKMVIYTTDNAYVSNDENTKTEITTNVSETATSNYAKKGNGYARITFIG